MKVTKVRGGATITAFGRTEHPDYYEASIHFPEPYFDMYASGETKAKAKAELKQKIQFLIGQLGKELSK